MSGTKLFPKDTLPTADDAHDAGVLFDDDNGKVDPRKVAIEVARQRSIGLIQNDMIEKTHATCNYTKKAVDVMNVALTTLTEKSNKWTHILYGAAIVIVFLYKHYQDQMPI